MLRGSFNNIWSNALEIFRGKNILWHIAFCLITYLLVVSGFDWSYFEATRGKGLQTVSVSAGILGFFVPVIVPVALRVWGEWKKDETAMSTAVVIAQAEIIALVVSSTYKAFTGRIQPEFLTHLSTVDISHQFNFGFFRHGIFWGWPSSHTTVAFAGAVAIYLLYPKHRLVGHLALLYTLYIGFGVSISIHWFSDFIAGAMLGTLVGVVIARRS